MKGYILLFSMVLISFLFQTTLIPLFAVYGLSLDLSLVIIVNFSLLLGPIRGISIGFFLGVLNDLYGSGFFGIHLFIKSLLGYLVGSLSQSIYPYNLLIPLLATIGASIFHQILSALLSEVLIFAMSWSWFWQRVLLQALLNGFLTLCIFPLCRWWISTLVKKKIL